MKLSRLSPRTAVRGLVSRCNSRRVRLVCGVPLRVRNFVGGAVLSNPSWRAFAPILCLAALGCSREEPASAPVTLSFDGRTWELVGPCDVGRLARRGMVAQEFKSTEPNLRLVELTLDERSAQAERLNVRIRRVQVQRDGR